MSFLAKKADRDKLIFNIKLRTLADFKRFLAQPGATIRVMRHDGLFPILPDDHEALAKRKLMWEDRTVDIIQTNGVRFSGGSWLYFKSAKEYRFDGTNVVEQCLDEGNFEKLIRYACSIK